MREKMDMFFKLAVVLFIVFQVMVNRTQIEINQTFIARMKAAK